MRTYNEHLSSQHRIAKIRPDLDVPAAAASTTATVASAPVADLLPLPKRHERRTTDRPFEMTRIDDRGRLSFAAACHELGWTPGDTHLMLARAEAFVSVTEAVESDERSLQLMSQKRLQLPRWATDLARLAPTSQALLEIDPVGEVRVYPAVALGDALDALHAGINLEVAR